MILHITIKQLSRLLLYVKRIIIAHDHIRIKYSDMREDEIHLLKDCSQIYLERDTKNIDVLTCLSCGKIESLFPFDESTIIYRDKTLIVARQCIKDYFSVQFD